jgi:autotransporter-associated beta strand protein
MRFLPQRKAFGLRVLIVCAPAIITHFEAEGKILQITIDSIESPAYSGQSFGSVGTYEILTGHARGEIDPNDPHNSIITDLNLAPTNSRGMVEYTNTFTLSKPVNLSNANGVMLYLAPNRGNRIGFNGVAWESGTTFLAKRGYMILHSGWQGDITPSSGIETVTVPVARYPDGSSVTGAVLASFVNVANGTKTVSLPSRQPAASLNTTQAVLTWQTSVGGPAMVIPSTNWAFSDCTSVAFPGVPSAAKISVQGGFYATNLYELSYTSKDPLVLGIGLAATRDIVSFFRYETNSVTNPLAGRVTNSIAMGISQSGNFIKTMIHLGFNQDESGRIVWDGANPQIAGRQTPLNFRFAIPGGAATLYEPGSETTLWWGNYVDTARGQTNASSMLARSQASGTVPKIFETFGSAEFWGLRMSPGLVGTSADVDIPLPSNVRRYYFPGTTHGGGGGGFNANLTTPASGYVLPANPNPQSETMRALFVALSDWVTKNTAPPASVYPRLATNQLAAPDHLSMGFPVIPGKPLPDGMMNPFYDYDLGPQFNYRDLSGVITIQPPTIKGILPMLVPKTDADGNEIGGLASTLHRAPLGTYLGWNVHSSGFYQGQGLGYVGGFIPFAQTQAARIASGDPRLSLEERYQTHVGYVAAVSNATQTLVAQRFLLPEDATNLIQQAQSSDVLTQPAGGFWIGDTSADWNNSSNWAGDVFPVGSATVNGGLTVPVISSSPVFSISNLYVGDDAFGELVLSNGSLTINNELAVSRNGGAGTMSQYGGTFNKTGGSGFMVGNGADQTGIFNMNGGTLTTSDLARIGSEPESLAGDPGNGTFNLSGGSVTALNFWQIGRNYGIGTMNMTGGNFYQGSAQYFAIANSGSVGTFNMSGGNLYSTNQILVAYANGVSGSVGIWNLSGNANVVHGGTKRFAIGIGGDGTLNQSGGNLIYTVSGVAAEIGVLSTFPGTGLWDISGGIAVLTNRLFIGDGAGSVGTLTLSGSAAMTCSGIQLGVSSATGTLNLNGGTLTVSGTITNGTGDGTFNFNGGTLKAGISSTMFMTNITTAMVHSGGAFIDTGNNVITIGQPLLNGGGGLVKSGSGVLTLAGTNTYNGSTVSSGILVVSGSVTGPVVVRAGATLGGNGSISGIVNVQPGGTIGAGTSIGKLTLGSSPIFAGTVWAELNRNNGAFTNDLIDAGSRPLTYNGVLLVTNIGAALQVNDTFKLFNTSGGYSGAFTIISRTPGQHVVWNTSNLTVNGTIRVAAAGPPLPTQPTNIVISISNNLTNVSWPSNYTGWMLQSNGVGLASTGSWFYVPGAELTNRWIQPVDKGRTNVFFRMNLP